MKKLYTFKNAPVFWPTLYMVRLLADNLSTHDRILCLVDADVLQTATSRLVD